ncbi:hypothetical protein AB0L44_22715 [Nonomuraea wenchangensis]|uniref:hypothetical protein n=1 Tax=Nonomuraea wenchangensis TaxID=568860 RepID=UPI0034289013
MGERVRRGYVLCLGLVAVTAAGCMVPVLGDPMPRPVGLERTDGGHLKIVVPLCDGEVVSAVEVQEHQTWRLVWRASLPVRTAEQYGTIILGDASGFARQETPLREAVPPHVSVSVKLSSGSTAGRGFLVGEVVGGGRVSDFDGEVLTEEEFRRRVTDEYC